MKHLLILLLVLLHLNVTATNYKHRIKSNRKQQLELLYGHSTAKVNCKIKPSFKHKMQSPRTPVWYSVKLFIKNL
jgi:hypothetical protein